MLPFSVYETSAEGTPQPALVMMPFLGGSQREWSEVVALLAPAFRCITLDLPGFGAASNVSGYSVREMADAVIATLSSMPLRGYVLVGHSMAGKVSAVVARTLLAQGAAFHSPSALILVAPSPPSPEPMSDTKRQQMLNFFRSPAEHFAQDRRDAETYVSDNLAEAIPAFAFDRTVDDVLGMNREAWTAWLVSGSNEDWASYVNVLNLPALIVAGAQDSALGPDAQRRLTLPHFSSDKLIAVDCSHLIPLEKPAELASLFLNFVQSLDLYLKPGTRTQTDHKALIASSRVSPQTREILLKRAEPDDPAYEPLAMTREALQTLRSTIDRVIPQGGDEAIDIAARLDRQLHSAKGDGWRYAVLPPDAEAYRTGFSLLDEFAHKLSATRFHLLTPEAQDSLLDAIASGRVYSAMFDLKRWFEDLRANAVQIFVSHPQTLASMGYNGIADDPNGFVQLGIGKREAWEPQAL